MVLIPVFAALLPAYVSAHVSVELYALNGRPCDVTPSPLNRYAPVITCFGTVLLALPSVTCVAVTDVAQLPLPMACAFKPTAGFAPLGTNTVEEFVKMCR